MQEVDSHPLIERFSKGVAVLNDFVWDPSSVISHLVSLFPYKNFFLELISHKLVTLFALTTAQRMQTLTAILVI